MFPSAHLVLLLAFPLALQAGSSRPIIGIVCQELDSPPPDCYIAASYVKAVEAAGARVAPIFISKPKSYYREMVKSLNGVVFPGGDASPTTVGGYYQAATEIFAQARRLNHDGDHFPVLGVCLGLEFLALLSNGGESNNTLDSCPGTQDVFLPLRFQEGFRNSSLYRGASQEVLRTLAMENVTANYHTSCLRPETNLRHKWRVLSTNLDSDGRSFVSSMETNGPMVALQFHPEKNAFEWQKKKPSYKSSLVATRHFYDWLVAEARENSHSFPDNSTELASLIYNYSPRFSGKHGDYFTQTYYFKQSTDHDN